MKKIKFRLSVLTHTHAKSSFGDDQPQSSFSAHCVWAKSALHRDFIARVQQSSRVTRGLTSPQKYESPSSLPKYITTHALECRDREQSATIWRDRERKRICLMSSKLCKSDLVIFQKPRHIVEQMLTEFSFMDELCFKNVQFKCALILHSFIDTNTKHAHI